MASIFDPFSYLDPARARYQMELEHDAPIFDNYSALDPARERGQIEAAFGVSLTPEEAMDPSRVLYEVENGGPQIIVTGTFDAPEWVYEDPELTPPNLKWLTTVFNDNLIDFTGATSVTWRNIGGAASFIAFTQKDEPLLASIDFGDLAHANGIDISLGDSVTSLKMDNLVSAGGNLIFSLNHNLETMSFPKLVSCARIEFDSCEKLVTVSFPALKAVTGDHVHGNDCALSQSSVDALLVKLASLDGTDGTTIFQNTTINLGGGTNAAPSATGLAAKATLEGRGCTVSVNS